MVVYLFFSVYYYSYLSVAALAFMLEVDVRISGSMHSALFTFIVGVDAARAKECEDSFDEMDDAFDLFRCIRAHTSHINGRTIGSSSYESENGATGYSLLPLQLLYECVLLFSLL